MNTFSWSKALGIGIATWTITTLALWLLASYTSSPLLAHGLVAVVGGLSAFLLTRGLLELHATQAIEYGLAFVATILVLDLAVTQWYDAHIFTTWQYWFEAALVLTAPLLRTQGAHKIARATI